MKLLKSILLLSLVLLFVSACKKGEQDPFLSLRTRMSRLTGEWKVTSISEQSRMSGATGSSTETTMFYDGQKETSVSTGTFSSTSTSEYTIEYVFEKDGTCKITKITFDDNGDSYQELMTGLWSFIAKNKNAGLKNKEALTISYTNINDDGDIESFEGLHYLHETLIIEQLKNKEIVIAYDESYDYEETPTSGWNLHTSRIGKMTLSEK